MSTDQQAVETRKKRVETGSLPLEEDFAAEDDRRDDMKSSVDGENPAAERRRLSRRRRTGKKAARDRTGRQPAIGRCRSIDTNR